MIPVTLTPEELDAVLSRVVLTQQEYGNARICRRLAYQAGVRTRDVNRDCSVGNISDLVTKSINPRIEDLGLYVACVKPMRPFKNRHQQATGEMLWSFYRDVAANDPDYDAAGLSLELDGIEQEHPDTERWEQAMEGLTDESC